MPPSEYIPVSPFMKLPPYMYATHSKIKAHPGTAQVIKWMLVGTIYREIGLDGILWCDYINVQAVLVDFAVEYGLVAIKQLWAGRSRFVGD